MTHLSESFIRQRERQQAEHSLHEMGFSSVTAEEICNDRVVMSLEDVKKIVEQLEDYHGAEQTIWQRDS